MSFSKLLCWLLLIDAPEDATFRSLEFEFLLTLPWLFIGAFAVAAGILMLVLYMTEKVELGNVRFLAGLGVGTVLRTMTLTLLFILLFRPVCTAEFVGERPRSIVVLLDHSQSMNQADKRRSPEDKLRVALAYGLVPMDTVLKESPYQQNLPSSTPEDPDRVAVLEAVFRNQRLKLLDGLAEKAPLRVFTFGEKLTLLADDATGRKPKKKAQEMEGLVLSTEALTYLADEGIPAPVLTKLTGLKDRRFPSREKLQSELEKVLDKNEQLHVDLVLCYADPLGVTAERILRLYKGKDQQNAAQRQGSGEPEVKKTGPENSASGSVSYETKTALWDAIHEVLQRKDGDPPAGIVLITDGQDNASKVSMQDAARRCAQAGVPLHVYGIGTAEGSSLRLRHMAAPETIFYDDKVNVTLRGRAQGFKKGDKVRIDLKLGGKKVATRELEAPANRNFKQELSFEWKKEGTAKPDKLELEAVATIVGQDTFRDKISKPVRVVDGKVRVLYIESMPRWEFKFLQQGYLLRDRRVSAKFMLLEADRETQRPPEGLKNPEDWPYLTEFPSREKLFASFDVLILGDVPSDWLGNERMTCIRDFVYEGGALIHIAGQRYAPASYAKTPLAEVLPVEFEAIRFKKDYKTRPQPYVPILTDDGEHAEILFLGEPGKENVEVWKKLSAEGRGFFWHYPIKGLRAGAISLLAHPKEKMGKPGDKKEKPMTVMATQQYGSGLVLFLGTDETWRWRANGNDRHVARLWGQIISTLGMRHLLGGGKRVHISMQGGPEVHLDSQSYLYVTAYDKQFRPFEVKDGAQIKPLTARLEYLDAKREEDAFQELKLEPVPGEKGRYRTLLAHGREGLFKIHVAQPDVANFEYLVTLPPNHEQEPAGMAENELREAARLSTSENFKLDRVAFLDLTKQSTMLSSGLLVTMLLLLVTLVGGGVILLVFGVLKWVQPSLAALALAVLLLVVVNGSVVLLWQLFQSGAGPTTASPLVKLEPIIDNEYMTESAFVDAMSKYLTKEELAEHKEFVVERARRGKLEGKFYREENLYRLVADVQPQKARFTIVQEGLLWNPLTYIIFALFISAEWVVRKVMALA